MKKILIIMILFICAITLSASKLLLDNEIMIFLKTYDLSYDNVKPYLNYNGFHISDYFRLEELRQRHNYSYLETVNYFYHQNAKPAIFINSYLVLVNKYFYLTKDYIPYNLVKISETMVKCANKDIMLQECVITSYIQMITDLKLTNLYIFSGYRDYAKQEALYKYYNDDNYSAKPGFSEHQTGLALDVSLLDIGLTDLFQDTPEYHLLLNNCYKYGFILRYPKNKQTQTGYYFEPWHFRYVGKIHAKYIMEHNLTLEEYIYANFTF